MSLRQLEHQQRSPLHICITGSSQGIGLAAARCLVAQGHVVYHACRTLERAQHAVRESGGGVALECDLNDLDSVRQCALQLKRMAPRLDVLCLNAGMAPPSTPGPKTTSSDSNKDGASSTLSPAPLTKQGFEACIGVNHLGHFLLTQLLINKLASSDGGGRLVITSSSVHDPATKAGKSGSGQGATLGDLSGLGVNLRDNPSGPTMVDGQVEYDGTKVYKDSKLCNILMAQHAAKLYSPKVLKLTFNPGLVTSTGLFRNLRQESPWRARALEWAAWALGISVPVSVGGDRLVYLATTPSPPSSSSSSLLSGMYFSAPVKSWGTTPEEDFVETAVSEEASKAHVAERLWERSLEIVNDWL
eukprot:scaffold701_cov158-Amphora_coffeaeformis.AAC.20